MVARWSELLGGDIDREYCLKLYDTYPQTSEPELLAGYTKVLVRLFPSPHTAKTSLLLRLGPKRLTLVHVSSVLVRPLQ